MPRKKKIVEEDTPASKPAEEPRPQQELNEENFLKAMSELGGNAVTTRQIRKNLGLPDCHTINDSRIRSVANKLEKDGKLKINTSTRIWTYSLAD